PVSTRAALPEMALPQAPPLPDAAARDGAPGVSPAAEAGADRGLLATSRSMAIASLASRVTGFLRSSMLVAAIGIGGVGDAYNVANNFPNMVYELLLGGVLSSVLIPLLVHAQEQDEDDGFAYTQRLLSVAAAALGLMTLVAVAGAPVIAGAFVSNPSQRHLTTLFATLLLPEIFFYGLGAMFMAVLNIRHSYAPGAWSPVLNNLVMIVTLLCFWALPGPKTLTPATMTTAQLLVLGIGTTVGIAAQALVLIPSLRKTGFRWKWRFRARPNELGRMREVGTLAGWVLGYVVASQVGVTVIAKVGVSHGAFTVFTNADLLLQMPYGILVVSLLTALMPRLSRSAARGQTQSVIDDLSLGARLSAVALIPITAGLIVLGPVLNVVLFAYGETSIDGARLIGTALAISAFGLFPFALVMLQLRVFYAMRDGRTPTLINIFMVTTKVVIVLICASTLHGKAHIAEALTGATSASYVVGAGVGHLALTRRLGPLGFSRVARTVVRIGTASIVGAAAALAIVVGIDRALGRGHLGSAVALVLGGAVGLAVMAGAAWRLRIPEVQDIAALGRRR
ncbi:MAG: murein biosynthesis integral membrane protein MurJ, partial [Actinomycetota bacterium]|nr:murein biosynthesis integral membrane protein MurJ [Actinomycetota bacterium]